MPSIVILQPLNENDEEKGIAEKNYLKIATLMNEMSNADGLSFSDFLKELQMDFQTYLLAVRSSLCSPKIFFQRSVCETRINNYNTVALKCWEANMDIQFILDPYACVSYIVSYISKGQRGLSNLLHQACKEARSSESDIKQQVRRIGNQFLSHVEIGAQEAVYLVLQMPLRKCTRSVDTNSAEKRVALLKSFTDLQHLPKNSTNIEADNVLKRYKRRPKKLNYCIYADFVSWYDTVYSARPKKCVSMESELPEDDEENNDDTMSESENEKETIQIL